MFSMPSVISRYLQKSISLPFTYLAEIYTMNILQRYFVSVLLLIGMSKKEHGSVKTQRNSQCNSDTEDHFLIITMIHPCHPIHTPLP